MFDVDCRSGLSDLPVNSSSATSTSSRPPAPCSAGRSMCRYPRIFCPATANATITPPASATACQAALCRSRAGSGAVSARKIGTMPGGSTITSRVTNAVPNSLRFTPDT